MKYSFNYLLIAFVFTTSIEIFSQEYGTYDREHIFNSDFSNDDLTALWKVNKGKKHIISEGILYTENTMITSKQTFVLNDSGNYELEFRVKHIPDANSKLDFYWKPGKTDDKELKTSSYIRLLRINSELLFIGYDLMGSPVKIKRRALESFINYDDFDKYTIRVINSTVHLFINEKLAGTIHTRVNGCMELMMFAYSSEFSVDYLRISLLKEKKAPPTKSIIIANTVSNDFKVDQYTYHALIIGNNDYQDDNIMDLEQPVSDATKLYDVLVNKYSFNEGNVIFLKNATRRDIIAALDKLSNSLTNQDNLLIFYAGHGHWDARKETGYWLPVDAEKDITADWLRNSTVQGYIEDIDTKHTLLIADACFGGGIFKTRAAFEDADRSINNLYKYESRKAMTSGMLNEVPDRSVFMENLIERLNDNNEKYIASSNLFFQFRENVMNNSNNAPQYGTIHNTGDKGGDFIFVQRTK